MIINFRLNPIDDVSFLTIDELHQEIPITGFFQLKFNNHQYGHYHNMPLHENEEGLYSLSTWFKTMLEACKGLMISNLVMVNDIESYKSLLLFEKLNCKELKVSLIQTIDKIGFGLVLLDKNISDLNIIWDGEIVEINNMKEEVITKGKDFISQLLELNPYFNQVPLIDEIISDIQFIENSLV